MLFFCGFFSVSDIQNELILHEAVIKNDVDAVKAIMKEPVDVNFRNNVSVGYTVFRQFVVFDDGFFIFSSFLWGKVRSKK